MGDGESKYTSDETNTMVELLFIDMIRRNVLESSEIVGFTSKLLELYLDNVDTSANNEKFRYEIRKDLLSYFITSNDLEKIDILDGYLDSWVYYTVFDSLHSLNKPLDLSDQLVLFLNNKMKETINNNYLRETLLNKIIDNKSCLSKIYHYLA
jgi:hypothetical protein